MNQLTIGSIISQGFSLGLKNLASLIGAVFLWIVTIWIPYLNVGTTIGLISIVVAMSRGKVISPTEIFDAKYRKYIGEFFLLVAMIYIGIGAGLVFVVIPGLVISLAWCLAIYLLIDKELNPMEAIKVSNQITYGHKWTIFFGIFLLTLILGVIVTVLGAIGGWIADFISSLLTLAGVIIFMPVILGAYAHIYGVLVQKIEQPAEE